MTPSRPDVAFIVVNYNTLTLLHDCLLSIERHAGVPHTVVVVDNQSTDGSAAMVQASFPRARLIANQENRGFPRAVNQGLRAVEAPFYYLLNADVRLLENSVSPLLAQMERHPEVGIAAPGQIDPEGRPVFTVHQDPTLLREFLRNLFFTDYWRYRVRGPIVAARLDTPLPVDWTTGAALIVRRQVVQTIGLMDEAVFMYGEEFDWCLRARRAGWQVLFVPQAVVVHHKGASADPALEVERYRHVVRANYYFFTKHFGWARLPFFVLAQLMGSLIRTAMAALLCAARHCRFCREMREHFLAIKTSLDPDLYRWLRQNLPR